MKLKYHHQYVVKVDRSGRLTVRNFKFLRKFNLPDCKSLSNTPYQRKAKIPLQEFIFSGIDEKRDYEENFNILRTQKGICSKARDDLQHKTNYLPFT